MTVYYSCLPSMLATIAHYGFSQSIGDGALQMKEVFGATVVGVYATDRPETACNNSLRIQPLVDQQVELVMQDPS